MEFLKCGDVFNRKSYKSPVTSPLQRLQLCLNLFLIFFWNITPIYSEERHSDKNPCGKLSEQIELVSKASQLTAPTKVGCEILSANDFVARHRILAQELGEDRELPFDRRLFEALFIIPSSYPFVDCMIKASADGALAFYDPIAKKIFLRDVPEIADIVVLHELVHALQDKLLNIRRYTHDSNLTSDQLMTRTALLEGHAVVVSESISPIAFSDPVSSNIEVKCKPPEALVALFDLPYDFGELVVRRAYASGGNEAAKKLLVDPPDSFLKLVTGRDKPSIIESKVIKKNSAGDCREDTLGVAIIQMLAKQVMNREDALRIARRWVGDTVRVCLSPGENGHWSVSWNTKWEREEDATAFFKMIKSLVEREHQTTFNSEANHLAFENFNGIKIILRSQGSSVRFETKGS